MKESDKTKKKVQYLFRPVWEYKYHLPKNGYIEILE